MRNILRKSTVLLLVFASMLMICIGLISLNTKNVLAEEPATISIDKASVYIDDAGIRYLVTIDKSTFEGLGESDEIGAYLAPTANLGGNELDKDSYVKTGVFKHTDFNLNEDERYQAYFYVYGIPAINNGDAISVRAYIKQGEAYTLSTTKSASIAKVAFDASKLDEDIAETIVNRYCKFNVTVKDSEDTILTTLEYTYGDSYDREVLLHRGKDLVVKDSADNVVDVKNLVVKNHMNLVATYSEIEPIEENAGVYTMKGFHEDAGFVNMGSYSKMIETTPAKSFEVDAVFTPDESTTASGSFSATAMNFAVKQGENTINFVTVTATRIFAIVNGIAVDEVNACKPDTNGTSGADIFKVKDQPTKWKMTYKSEDGFNFYKHNGSDWVSVLTSPYTLAQINGASEKTGVVFDAEQGFEVGVGMFVGNNLLYPADNFRGEYGGTISNFNYSVTADYTVKYMLNSAEIRSENATGAIGSSVVVSPVQYQAGGVVYMVDKSNLPIAEDGTDLYEVQLIKNFAISELGFVDGSFHAWANGAFDKNDTWATHANYINVKAGDSISIADASKVLDLMIHEFNTETNMIGSSIATANTVAFTKDCAIIISLKKGTSVSVQDAFKGLSYSVSASNDTMGSRLVDVDKTEFAWKDNYQLKANDGALHYNIDFCVTVKYIKVNKGDFIKFTNNSALVIATYSLSDKVITNEETSYIASPGATYVKVFTEDCYVRFAIKKAGNATTLQQAMDSVSCYITAEDYAIDGDDIDSSINWISHQNVNSATGALAPSELYYTTNDYIKVKAGDAIFFTNGTSLIIAEYSLADKSLLATSAIDGQGSNPVYLVTPANPQMFLFTQDCYVRFSIRIAPSGVNTATLTLEQARDTVTYAITADNSAITNRFNINNFNLTAENQLVASGETAGTMTGSSVYYSTMGYIKVNAGDSITFNHGTPLIFAKYNLSDKTKISCEHSTPAFPYTVTFSEACYVNSL